ncbi:MAG TPA: peptidylprolyl isomerase [Pyrinomonadaceae bacterium]|nr:peptidylprolyl isomerase [Pyrinomonadaceae bacterium]
MKIKLLVLGLIISALACSGGTGSNSRNSSANAEVKKGVAPAADSEIAVIEMETPAFGTIKMELYSNIAPQAVTRFKELARAGYYDGIEFHRINETVIQAGDSNTKPGAAPRPDGKQGDSGKPNVPAEFSDVLYDAGIVGAARLGNDVNSANSQFFIMLKREPQFDQKYTVFGKVIEGLGNARTIAGAPKGQGERPAEPVRIKTIRIERKS